MFRMSIVRLAIATAVLCPSVASAREVALDYRSTLDLAAERAPAVLAARGRIGEAEARKAGAGVRFRDNPELDLEAGPRLGNDETRPQLSIGVSQTFELGGRRGARLGVASSEVAGAEADADEVLRVVLREAALAYYRALLAEERLRLAQAVERMAGELLAATERRLAKGDGVALDVNLAKSGLARARSAVRAAEADREAALGDLRALVGLEPGDTLVVKGDLAARKSYVLDTLLAAARQRPELRGLDAERDEGAAWQRLGDGYRWPDLRIGLTYAHEDDADLLLGGLTITLPFWERGEEQRRVGRAIAARAATEQDGRWRAIDAQVRAAFAVHERRLAAVDEYEQNVLPLTDENDALLKRSYDAGQLTLADYLVARRELVDARAEYLERLFELAAAAVELESSAGVMR